MAEAKIDLNEALRKALENVRPQFEEAIRPARLLGVAAEAIEEVSRARSKHGPNTDLAEGADGPNGTFLQDMGIPLIGGRAITNFDVEEQAKFTNDTLCAQGRKHTRAGIVFEEFLEALAATSDEDRRTELIQTIAMLLDWTLDLQDKIAAAGTDVDEVCS